MCLRQTAQWKTVSPDWMWLMHKHPPAEGAVAPSFSELQHQIVPRGVCWINGMRVRRVQLRRRKCQQLKYRKSRTTPPASAQFMFSIWARQEAAVYCFVVVPRLVKGPLTLASWLTEVVPIRKLHKPHECWIIKLALVHTGLRAAMFPGRCPFSWLCPTGWSLWTWLWDQTQLPTGQMPVWPQTILTQGWLSWWAGELANRTGNKMNFITSCVVLNWTLPTRSASDDDNLPCNVFTSLRPPQILQINMKVICSSEVRNRRKWPTVSRKSFLSLILHRRVFCFMNVNVICVPQDDMELV